MRQRLQEMKENMEQSLENFFKSKFKEMELEVLVNDAESVVEISQKIAKGEFEVEVIVGDELVEYDLGYYSRCVLSDEYGDPFDVSFKGEGQCLLVVISILDEDSEVILSIKWLFSLNGFKKDGNSYRKGEMGSFFFIKEFLYDGDGYNPEVSDKEDDMEDYEWLMLLKLQKLNSEANFLKCAKKYQQEAFEIIDMEYAVRYQKDVEHFSGLSGLNSSERYMDVMVLDWGKVQLVFSLENDVAYR